SGGGLEKQQAVFGACEIDAACACFASERCVVEIGIEAEQRELESVLSSLLSVTGTGITAVAGEDRLNVPFEVDRLRRGCESGNRQDQQDTDNASHTHCSNHRTGS